MGSLSVTLSSTSVGATQVAYGASFAATSGLTAGTSTITISAPAGTTFPSSGCVNTVTDVRTHQSACASAVVSNAGATATITTPIGGSPGDRFSVTANGVANTSTAGTQSVGVATSSDPTVVSQPVTFTAATRSARR